MNYGMKKRTINIEKSKQVYEHCASHLNIKECYNNVFKVVTDYISEFDTHKWSVAYGYMTLTDNLLCRHCFIIDENGDVIDPTIPIIGIKADAEYFEFKIFTELNDYLQAIAYDEYFPALTRYLRVREHKFMKTACDNGYICIG